MTRGYRLISNKRFETILIKNNKSYERTKLVFCDNIYVLVAAATVILTKSEKKKVYYQSAIIIDKLTKKKYIFFFLCSRTKNFIRFLGRREFLPSRNGVFLFTNNKNRTNFLISNAVRHKNQAIPFIMF